MKCHLLGREARETELMRNDVAKRPNKKRDLEGFCALYFFLNKIRGDD